MNKTPHEQCAEEIWNRCKDYLPDLPATFTGDFESILTKHFPQPTPIPSLNEVVEKCHSDIFDTSFLRMSNKERIKQAILEYNASLLAEVERLTTQLLIIGDKAVIDWDNETVGQVDAVVKAKPCKTYIEFVRKLYTRGEEIDQLRTQLSTADRTGYARGVNKCLELSLNINDGHEWPVSRAILNLLNKKD